jgi:hypothetical protein
MTERAPGAKATEEEQAYSTTVGEPSPVPGREKWFGPTLLPVASVPPALQVTESGSGLASELDIGTGPSRPDDVRRRITRPAIIPKDGKRDQDIFVPMEKWAGVVTHIGEGSFRARVIEQLNGGGEEEAEFPIRNISEGDRALLEPGAVFYWVIGFRETPSGQRMSSSTVRFRRLAKWGESEIRAAELAAEELQKELGWEDSAIRRPESSPEVTTKDAES